MIDNTRHYTFVKTCPYPAAANATSPGSTATTATAATRAETTPAAPPSGGKSPRPPPRPPYLRDPHPSVAAEPRARNSSQTEMVIGVGPNDLAGRTSPASC